MRTILAVLAIARVAAADVPDPSLAAARERDVRLEQSGAPAVEGRVLAFDLNSVTVALASGEIVTVPRAQIERVVLVEGPLERPRRFGLHSSLLGTALVDADVGRYRAFASANLLLPALTATGSSTYFAAAVGGGLTLRLHPESHWRVDVLGQVVPLHTTSFYWYLGFGLAGGFHYTARSGISIGISFPIVGFATRVGHSPYGYDPSFRYHDSLYYYYFGAIAGMPMLTFGYRFATGCPASISNSSAASDASTPASK